MAESSDSGGNILADAFKSFPLATIILLVVFVYMFWRATGGIERGIERRIEGRDSLFIEVSNLPGEDGRTFFGTITEESLRER